MGKEITWELRVNILTCAILTSLVMKINNILMNSLMYLKSAGPSLAVAGHVSASKLLFGVLDAMHVR